jgi:hypothetical protein
MWRTGAAIPWLAALAVATTVGCGGDSSGPGGGEVEAGRFTAELRGGFERQISGTAFYFQSEEGLTISLSDEDPSGVGVVLARGNPSLPSVAVYPVLPGEEALSTDDFFLNSFWQSSNGLILCLSGDLNDPSAASGSLNVTASGSNLEADFTTLVACLDPGTGQLVSATITGRFNAEEGPTEGE